TVYDLMGQKIRTLLRSKVHPGNHFVRWDGRDDDGNAVPSGIYFYTLESMNRIESKKMMLVR
ncbi:MAG TPA: hypothetical protein ENF20_05690, partial [Candidatus Marinimicrobia bacterium]|nr:hypothetical protein [Candidatus Neomarinimicrobiota bacterium]